MSNIKHTHHHTYHFIREYRDFENSKVYSKFACLCGAVKRVEQFEEADADL